MEERGLIPVKFIINNLMDAHFKAGDVKKGLDLHKEMLIKGFEPDVVTTSAAIDGLCKNGLLQEAKVYLVKAKEANEVTYTALVDGLCKQGNMNDADKDKLARTNSASRRKNSSDTLTIACYRIVKAICGVGLAKSKSGIFVEAIHCLLVLATPVKLILIGVFLRAMTLERKEPWASASGKASYHPVHIGLATDRSLSGAIAALPARGLFARRHCPRNPRVTIVPMRGDETSPCAGRETD
ncbi:hypothetical protein BHM03_00052304, partial [Ensete ventricosum]